MNLHQEDNKLKENLNEKDNIINMNEEEKNLDYLKNSQLNYQNHKIICKLINYYLEELDASLILKSGNPQPKMSNVHIGIHAKVEDPKVRVSVLGASGKSKPKPRQSGKDLSHAIVKEVKLPGKIFKMKDLISLQYNDPIHDVIEIPRFEIYKS